MKFIVDSAELVRKLQSVAGVLSTNNALPILDNFLFDLKAGELYVSASDLETTMTAKVDLEKVENTEKGKVAIPAKILLDTVKSLSGPLNFTVKEGANQVEVKSSFGKYKLSGFNGNEFPKLPGSDKTNSLDIPSHVLLEAINNTLFATGTDELRPVMTGVYCQLSPENIIFVATDAHRLVRYKRTDASAKISVSFIIPKKPLNLLKNTLPDEDVKVNVDYNEANAFFKFGDYHMICRLIDGKYPNYEAVIPKDNPNKLNIDRDLFLKSIRRVSIFSNKSTNQVKLKIAGSNIQISAEDTDYANKADENLKCDYQGEDMEIAFNAKFIADMLSNIHCDEIQLEMSAPNRAGIITPSKDSQNSDEDLLMLVMPVMMN